MDGHELHDWTDRLDELCDRIGGCFPRSQLRQRARAYVRGLLGPVQRKNGWQLAAEVGAATPHGFQRLLGRARWDV